MASPYTVVWQNIKFERNKLCVRYMLYQSKFILGRLESSNNSTYHITYKILDGNLTQQIMIKANNDDNRELLQSQGDGAAIFCK